MIVLSVFIGLIWLVLLIISRLKLMVLGFRNCVIDSGFIMNIGLIVWIGEVYRWNR